MKINTPTTDSTTTTLELEYLNFLSELKKSLDEYPKLSIQNFCKLYRKNRNIGFILKSLGITQSTKSETIWIGPAPTIQMVRNVLSFQNKRSKETTKQILIDKDEFENYNAAPFHNPELKKDNEAFVLVNFFFEEDGIRHEAFVTSKIDRTNKANALISVISQIENHYQKKLVVTNIQVHE